ncbi:MAG: hypothetical protein HY721_06930, partial [Planctomycetes bacterium]|nr:hypothetical protein [Planctomycetota bacterium]
FFSVEPLPPGLIQVQARFQIAPPQDKGLKILGSYPPVPGDPLAAWRRLKASWAPPLGLQFMVAHVVRDLTHRSLQADGSIAGFYPVTGVLELRGTPPPWESYRPNTYGQPAFGKNPDDVVEWVRYAEVFDGNVGGEQFHLFVGRLGSRFNFRGYPEWDNPSLSVDLRKQLDHPRGEPLRLVMELSEGGAGHGDYVTIATSDPRVYEPQVRRAYKVLEHEDGRFFVSLLDVGSTGLDVPGSPGIYKNRYTRAMNPRLVKFPTWGLPEIGTGTVLLFGNAFEGSAAGAGRTNPGGVRHEEDEDPTGITIDELRRLQNRTIWRDPRYAVRFVVVPLEGGRVQFRGGGPGQASISGRIPRERSVSRSSPLEVLVVTLSRERGAPALFGTQGAGAATGLDEGLLRIGDEVFYFEDPYAGQGSQGAKQIAGTAQLGNPKQQQNPQNPQNPNLPAATPSRERDPLARTTVWDQIPATNVSGHFEREGFARLEDHDPERRFFHEVFYYRQLGGGFSQCLRGQFATPIALNTRGAVIRNVSRRLRLVGRGLLGTERASHGLGDPVTLAPYATVSPITGPMTPTGIHVKDARFFSPSGGYLLLDSGDSRTPWEITAHLGPSGDGLLLRPRDQRGRGILRACFGTQERPVTGELFAYEMPYRYPDRYEPQVESESLACLQKSFRVPGAYWNSLSWLERPPRTVRERRCDVVVALRFDGAPDWDAKPANEPGGLYLLEDAEEGDPKPLKSFPLERRADQVELRVYFRYKSGAFQRLGGNRYLDDWKETPVLEKLTLEYEKDGVVTRHEELPF